MSERVLLTGFEDPGEDQLASPEPHHWNPPAAKKVKPEKEKRNHKKQGSTFPGAQGHMPLHFAVGP